MSSVKDHGDQSCHAKLLKQLHTNSNNSKANNVSHKNSTAKHLAAKQFKSFLLFCLAGMCAVSVVNAQTSNPRQSIPLDEGWRFFPGDDPAAKQPGFDDSKWKTLNIPHDWSIEAPAYPPPGG